MSFVKDIRESRNLKQDEFAKLMSKIHEKSHPGEIDVFSSGMVQRYENNPDLMSMAFLAALTEFCGVRSIAELSGQRRMSLDTPNTEDKLREVHLAVQQLNAYLLQETDENALKYDRQLHTRSMQELQTVVSQWARKPVISFVGSSSSGKSTLINNLLKRSYLPASCVAQRPIPVLLRHIQDKPAFIGDCRVIVLRDRSEDLSVLNGWYEDQREYLEQHLIAKGDYELLEEYLEIRYDTDDHESETASLIVVYVNSPLLLNCDLIEIPGEEIEQIKHDGFGKNTSPLASVDKYSDAVVFLSVASRFLPDKKIIVDPTKSFDWDLAMAAAMVKRLPRIEENPESEIGTLGNIFFVASQADTIMIEAGKSAEDILKSGAERLHRLLDSHPTMGENMDEAVLCSRFYTLEIASQSLSERFLHDFTAFVEKISAFRNRLFFSQIKNRQETEMSHLENRMNSIVALLDTDRSYYDTLMNLEVTRRRFFNRQADVVVDAIEESRRYSADACRERYSEIISAEHIRSVIEKHGFSKRDQDMKALATLLNAELEDALTEILAERTNQLRKDIRAYIDHCEQSLKDTGPSEKLTKAFQMERAFAEGLNRSDAHGALAAQLPNVGTLDSAIAADAASIIPTAAAVAAAGALLIPVSLGFAAGIMTGLGSILDLGGTWKKVIGSKVAKQYENVKVLPSLLQASGNYWQETKEAFRASVEAIESEWQTCLQEYRNAADSLDKEQKTGVMETYKAEITFWKGLPYICPSR